MSEARETESQVKYSKQEGLALIPGTHVTSKALGYTPIISVLKRQDSWLPGAHQPASLT